MFRFIRFIFTLVIIVACVVGGYFWVARIPTIERFLSQKLDARVSLENVSLSWDKLTMHHLKIAGQAPANITFQADELCVKISYLQLLRKNIHLDRVKVINPTLTVQLYNFLGSDNNLTRIFAENSPTQKEGERQFSIGELCLINTRIQAAYSSGKELAIPPIPYLEFENIGSHRSLPLIQIEQLMIRNILASQKNLAPLLPNYPTTLAEEDISPFEKLFSKLRQKAADLLQKVKP